MIMVIKGTRQGVLLSKYIELWNDIREYFNLMTHTYQVLPAVTKDLKQEAHKVRHNVYCAELKYEEGNLDGTEKDGYDQHSTQMVVYSRTEKSYIGCVRLVHGQHQGSNHHMPLEHHCQNGLNQQVMSMIKSSGHKYAEVSRLAIDREYRHIGRKKSDRGLGKRPSSKSSCVLLSLYLGVFSLAKQQKIRYLFAMVEPRLLKNLHHHSIPAMQIGDGVDHRGLRVPIMIDVEDIERIIPKVMRPLYSAIHKDISKLLGTVQDDLIPTVEEYANNAYFTKKVARAQSTASN